MRVRGAPEVEALELLLLAGDGVAERLLAGFQGVQRAAAVLQRRQQHLLQGARPPAGPEISKNKGEI